MKEQLALPENETFEIIAEKILNRRARLWKPGTVSVNRSYYRNQILPYFRGRSISTINSEDVQHWFGSLHTAPSGANRAIPVLSGILTDAEMLGLRPKNSNPCRGLRRYRVAERSRFLNSEEVHRLGVILKEFQSRLPMAVAVVRLLLLTGCRQGEIRHLRWREYRDGRLFLSDSKSGPRTVWLSSAGRAVLEELPITSDWVFPSSCGNGPMANETLYRHWRVLREAAGMLDLRLHDLRHSYASLALRYGESVPIIGSLLGHRDAATTLRYLHFDDGLALSAVEVANAAIGTVR